MKGWFPFIMLHEWFTSFYKWERKQKRILGLSKEIVSLGYKTWPWNTMPHGDVWSPICAIRPVKYAIFATRSFGGSFFGGHERMPKNSATSKWSLNWQNTWRFTVCERSFLSGKNDIKRDACILSLQSTWKTPLWAIDMARKGVAFA